jgi:tetratricopeptide (TPR) repeat protein
MRRLLQQISDRLQAFIDQRDNLALVLCSPAADALPLLKILEGLEEMSTSDLFWSFTDNFTDAADYANTVVTGFANKHEVMRLAMEKERMPPWPPIPPGILSEDAPPAQWLRELAAFSRELLPIPNGGNNVWIFYPLAIANHAAFATLMEEVLRHEFPFPWCHHLRFIMREDPADRALQQVLANSPRIEGYQPDLSAESINRSMEEEVADESLPLEERLGTLVVLAGNDFAFQRYAEALEKYELLLQYHAPMGNYPIAALALNGMGEVYEKMGDVERANESYEAALIPASHGDNPPIPIFLNVVLNLANLRLAQERWEDAEACYDMAQQLATVARNAPVKIRSLENLGVCQQRQGKLDEAARSWNDGAVIAAQLEDVELCRSLLEHLAAYYAETGQTEKERELREQLAVLGNPEGN